MRRLSDAVSPSPPWADDLSLAHQQVGCAGLKLNRMVSIPDAQGRNATGPMRLFQNDSQRTWKMDRRVSQEACRLPFPRPGHRVSSSNGGSTHEPSAEISGLPRRGSQLSSVRHRSFVVSQGSLDATQPRAVSRHKWTGPKVQPCFARGLTAADNGQARTAAWSMTDWHVAYQRRCWSAVATQFRVCQSRRVVAFAPGDKDDLKPGTKIFIFAAKKLPDGTLQAARVNYGKDGLTPAM